MIGLKSIDILLVNRFGLTFALRQLQKYYRPI